jgi:hypothetical protein
MDMIIIYSISCQKHTEKCDFVAHIEKCVSRERGKGRLTTVSVDMETVNIFALSPAMEAMSFNENNYSVNYLIWDQETNFSSSSVLSSVYDDKEL